MLCVPDDCVSATQGCPCIEAQCLPGLMCDGGLCQPETSATDSSTGAAADSSSSGGGESDLVLHLPLDDDFMALSGATDIGPLELPVVCDGPGCPAKVPGRIGDAASFTGSSYLTVAGTGPLDLAGAFTIALWVRDTTNSTSTRVFLNRLVGDGNLASYEIEFYSGQLFAAVSDGTTPYTLGADHAFDPNQPWFHVALVVDGATATLYRDAVAVATVDGVSIDYQDAPLVLGADNDNGNIFDDFFVGELDDLRVYAHALDVVELEALIVAAG
ncbi:MAG: LamG domain-containing protein [Deltaproteobacteria bacterium]|nr:LamG domain-containing protein [Deltaproteobacteria bacterium]